MPRARSRPARRQWVGLAVSPPPRPRADQLTKCDRLEPARPRGRGRIVGPFTIHHVREHGDRVRAVRGCDLGRDRAHGASRSAALVAFFARSARASPAAARGRRLVLGGSVSNLVDRLRLGHVTDFLDLDYWPAFNLADTFIVVGVGAAVPLVRRGRPVERRGWHVTALAFLSRRRAAPRRSSIAALPGGRDAGSPPSGSSPRGGVLVDGQRRPKSHRLEGGEELELDLPEARDTRAGRARPDGRLRGRAPARRRQAGRPRRPPVGLDERVTLAHGLLELGAAGGDPERPGIVHRLDRDTSGLLSSPARRRPTSASRGDPRAARSSGGTSRSSRARPRSRTGRITAPIGRDRRDRTRHSLDTETRATRSRGSRCASCSASGRCSSVRLETGRTHQIRVHLEAIGCRSAGDPVYGVAGRPRARASVPPRPPARASSTRSPGADSSVDVAASGRSRGRARRRAASAASAATIPRSDPPTRRRLRTGVPAPSARFRPRPPAHRTNQPKGPTWQSSP